MIPCCGNNVCERIDGESYSVCSDDCEKNDDDAIQDCINKYSSSDILRSNCFNDVIDKYGYSDKIIDYEKEKCQNKYDSLYSLCLKKIAEEYAIEGICGELSSWSEKDDCYENVAVKKQDYNICLKIELGLSLGDCFYYVNLKAKSDCSGLNGDYKIMCLAKIEGNSFKCDDISDSQLKTRCRSMSFRVPTRYDDYIYW